jgi:hypothetical protein
MYVNTQIFRYLCTYEEVVPYEGIFFNGACAEYTRLGKMHPVHICVSFVELQMILSYCTILKRNFLWSIYTFPALFPPKIIGQKAESRRNRNDRWVKFGSLKKAGAPSSVAY